MEQSIENLAQWMTLLPEPIKQIPIINLAIPGKKKWTHSNLFTTKRMTQIQVFIFKNKTFASIFFIITFY